MVPMPTPAARATSRIVAFFSGTASTKMTSFLSSLSFFVRVSEELAATVPPIDGESSIHEATMSYRHFKAAVG